MTETTPPVRSAAPRAVGPARGRTPATSTSVASAATAIAVGLTALAQIAIAIHGPLTSSDLAAARAAMAGRMQAASIEPPAASPAMAPIPRSVVNPVRVASAEHLARLFDRLDYRLDPDADGAMPVPAVVLAALPPDLAAVAPVDDRKALFIRAVLPVVLHANAAVLRDRAGLEAVLEVLEAGSTPSAAQTGRVQGLAGRYGLSDLTVDAAGIRRLLRRVDAVPASLAVAQAIVESGWGSSRFARTGNALFGQWTWNSDSGLVPAARAAGSGHRVRAFDTLAESARAYLLNLNTHPAYSAFRSARAAARAASGDLPSGSELAGRLTRYSERGKAYVRDLRSVMRQNRLARLDDATLDTVTAVAAAQGSPGTATEG